MKNYNKKIPAFNGRHLFLVIEKVAFMFRPALLIFSLLLSGGLPAQSPGIYTADLDRLSAILKKTPSFKDQVKGAGLKEYNRVYDSLRADSAIILNDFAAFTNLSRLFFLSVIIILGFTSFRLLFLINPTLVTALQYSNTGEVLFSGYFLCLISIPTRWKKFYRENQQIRWKESIITGSILKWDYLGLATANIPG